MVKWASAIKKKTKSSTNCPAIVEYQSCSIKPLEGVSVIYEVRYHFHGNRYAFIVNETSPGVIEAMLMDRSNGNTGSAVHSNFVYKLQVQSVHIWNIRPVQISLTFCND